MHATCINAHEVRGRLSGLLDPFTIFCPKVYIFTIIFPPLKLQVLFFILDLAFIQIFGKLLSLSLLECLEGFLVVNKSHSP